VTTSYRPDIDGLRALAVGAVVLFHAFPSLLPGGFLGVDVFFVISGYLITGMILEGIRARTFSITGFYLRRARRILPALLTMLLVVSLLALLILMPDELERFAQNVTASALFVPNLFIASQSGYFDAAAAMNPLLHLWSLGVEEQFYLLWPVLLILCVPRARPRVTIAIIGGIAMASFIAHIVISRYSAGLSYYLPFTRFWQLLTGALLAAAAVARVERTAVPATATAARESWKGNAMSVTGLLLVVGSILATRAGSETFVAVAVPVTLGSALFIAAGMQALPNRVLFAARPAVYFGLISYPLYLWHWPFLSFLGVLDLDRGTSGRLLRVAVVLVAIVAAILTYHFIELPVRKRRDLRRLGVGLASLLGVAAFAGVAVSSTGGIPQRTSLQYNPFEWPPAMRLEQRCAALYGQPEDLRENAFCIRNDYARDPSIVMIGDSHANMFIPGVRAAYPEASIVQIGGSACPYLRDTEFWNDDRRAWRRVCPPLIDSAYRAITPATQVVILIARMPMYISTPDEYAATFDFVSPKHFESPLFPGASPAATYEHALRRELTQLVQAQREVVLVLPVPALDFRPRSCAPVRPVDSLLPARSADSCSVPRQSVETRHANSRSIVARVVRELADPRVHVVDPMDALCDARACHAVIDGKLMYRDDNHLTVEGSRYVWSRIRPRNLGAFAAPPRDAQDDRSLTRR
jgi:peptidoglycan/LPS O-acetylase OafA/YrhL